MDISIMYHYVQNPTTFKGSVPISIKNFRKQIELLSRDFKFIEPDELLKPSVENRCVITFDDGTKDQYENAYKILKEMGIPAYFTVMSVVFTEQTIPVFHLVHNVLHYYNSKDIFDELNKNFNLPDLSSAHKFYYYEQDIYRRYIKYLFNFVLSEDISREYLTYKILKKYSNLNKFIDDFYISKNEFKEMDKNGMTLGVHAHKHLAFSGNSQQFFKDEIQPCINFMKNELNINPKWYTPAFGGGEGLVEMKKGLEPLLVENGIKGAFTTESGVNKYHSTFWFKRYDCNKIKNEIIIG